MIYYGRGSEHEVITDDVLRKLGKDVVRKEAEKLISMCENALEFLSCPGCKKPVYKVDEASAEFIQCQCGHLRWQYGKA